MPASAEIRYRLAARPGRGRGALAKRANADRLSPPLPRITHLMALAIKLQDMLREGVARNYSELARLGHVSRARVSQIMSLLQLAPDLQEELLFLPAVEQGRKAVTEPVLRKVARQYNWDEQRQLLPQLVPYRSAPLAAPVRHRRGLRCPG